MRRESNVIKFPRPRTPGAERLRRALCASGLTQEEAGKLVGVSGRQVRKWLTSSPVGPVDLLVALEERARRAA